MYRFTFNSGITLMLLLWFTILKRTESSSCSCENACRIMNDFDASLTKVISIVESRTSYIKNIEDIERKLKSLENSERVIRRGKSLPSQDLSTKKISEGVNILKTESKNLEKVLRYVVLFLGSQDEKEVETLKNEVKEDDALDRAFKELFSKVKNVAKRTEVKILNDRLHLLEDRVSKCEERHLELASNITKARKDMDGTLNGKAREWEKRLQSLESTCETKVADLEVIPNEIKKLSKESIKQKVFEKRLQRNLQNIKDNLQDMGTRVLSNVANSSQKILEDFKEEWNINCSKGIAPCYFIDISQPSYIGNQSQTWNHIDDAESFEKPEYFWGCKPLRLADYPEVSTRRDDERKTIWFRCKDGHEFVGIDFMKCIQNGIWVGREEPPECPER